ncbi:unnamed protein product, partial [marine sediment metagenome]
MKKILFILFLIPTLIYGQDIRIVDLDAATDPDPDDITYWEEDGVAKNITKELLQETVTDSLAEHIILINDNITDIENLQELATTITYNANWVNDVNSDGITGDASALTTVGDNDTLQIEEATGATPIDTRVSFKNVTEFNNVQIVERYQGGAGHEMHVELYNPTTTAWVVIDAFSDQDNETFLNIPIINGADYIDGDSVIVRLEHENNGIASHYLWVDYLVLKKTPEMGGGGVSSHYAL